MLLLIASQSLAIHMPRYHYFHKDVHILFHFDYGRLFIYAIYFNTNRWSLLSSRTVYKFLLNETAGDLNHRQQ